MQVDILREKFLNFFRARKHKIVESDSLVPKDDPTVLFTPAGMNQFKKQFLGSVTDFSRAASAQRCLRTDDLDKVGKTTGHHTFFEMLGNFSFGDYFKKDAIIFAWEFLTEELSLSKDKLWVSVYKDDDDAYKIWKDLIKVPLDKIIKLGDKENFWPQEAKEKGPNGPCGPCSEVFFDLGPDKGCGKADCDPSCDCGRFVELWNLVFTQFNRREGGILEPLPQKNIDTGMGLERLTAVIEQAPNNFETDLFKPLLKEIIPNTKHQTPNTKEFMYAVADHIRAIVFAIYDGVLPSNEGRGYVVRKLIRKSSIHLRALGIEKPFLYKLVPVLSEIMKNPYPQLLLRRENIAQIIQAEEKSFINILNSSDTLFSKIPLTADVEKVGEVVFQLYDTYGMPVEETENWLKKQGFKNLPAIVKVVSKKLEEQKSRSKLQSAMKGEVFGYESFPASISKRQAAGSRIVSLKDWRREKSIAATKFSGYKAFEASAKILAIIKDGKEVKKAAQGEEVKIVLDKTVFYAESGGQVGDTGTLIKGKNIFEVLDTKQIGKIIIHIGRVKEGNFKKSDSVLSKIDIERRLCIARNHTATHLLQAALRKVLGPHVQQQGSLVEADKLRFDFSHFKDVSEAEIDRIEELANGYILANHPLSAKEMPLAAARKTGALAFFTEKYESRVRVVSIADFSHELCGGTHLESTGQIGLFKIIRESSVASGVRRIEAVTGRAALKAVKTQTNIIKDVAGLLNVPEEKITAELEKRLDRIKELEKQLNTQKLNIVRSSADELVQSAEAIGNIKLITKVIADADMPALRSAVDLIKQRTQGTVIALASGGSGRVFLVIGITADLAEKGIDASALVGRIANFIGGSGGGRKDFAQAGGNQPENLKKAFEELKNIIAQMK